MCDVQGIKGKPSQEQQAGIAARSKAMSQVCKGIRIRLFAEVTKLGDRILKSRKPGESIDSSIELSIAEDLAGLAGKNDKALGKVLDAALAELTLSKAKERQAFLSPLHGTRDWFPSEMRFRNYLFQEFRAVGVSHGFEEYDVCVLERQHLFKLKAGKAGEEIVDQMYAFTDKDGLRWRSAQK